MNIANEGVSEESIADTFVKFRNQILNIIYSILGNKDDAQDVIQIAFLKCWKKKDSWHEIKNVKSWVFKVAANAAKDFRQDFWNRNAVGLSFDGEYLECRSDLFLELEQQEKLARISDAINRLPFIEKEVFLLNQEEKMTAKEISKLKKIPLGTVKTRIRSSWIRLRKIFERGV